MKILYDVTLKRPGCVLLQAATGGEQGMAFHTVFPAETWLVYPTEGMRLYEVTPEQLVQLGHITREAMKGQADG